MDDPWSLFGDGDDGAPQPPEPPVIVPAKRKRQRRVGAVLAVAGVASSDRSTLESAVRAVGWEERGLEWHGVKGSSIKLGAADCDESGSAGTSKLVTEIGTDWLVWQPPNAAAPAEGPQLDIACSLEIQLDEDAASLSRALLSALQGECTQCEQVVVAAARVLLVTHTLTELPLVDLSDGIATLHWVPDDGSECAERLMREAGMLVMPIPSSAEDIAALRSLVDRRVAAAEVALKARGCALGDGGCDFSELCSRGPQRWDMRLCAVGGEAIGGGAVPEDAALLERVALKSPWSAAVMAALGGEEGVSWQAGAVVSRPGADAGVWHSDGLHTRRTQSGEERPYAVCAFVPLVPLKEPVLGSDGASHGRGCTAFWPGSHRDPECQYLGPVAARLGAAVAGAPLAPGAALLYDYTTVHAALPNDAADDGSGDRPILQFTFFAKGFADRARNFGREKLFP
eukprot:TRINITY_DN37835_c0_g1_i1.p1 TRINITY_DN37835_c0_g1~~TRINITY_DN37835_c0_g1_i1.p1  ORF type:complete len:456 (-),score=106.81 TRINITY_DN37835_c0_g1_i1:71-1438(-)